MIIREPTELDAEAIREVKSLAVVPLREIYRPTKVGLARKAQRASIRREVVCEKNGRVVGTVAFEDRQDCFHILGPMVHPSFQRQGIARALLEHVAGLARQAGKRALSLNAVRQTGNVPIFSRLGFRVIREQVDEDPLVENLTDEDLIDVYMERSLDDMLDQVVSWGEGRADVRAAILVGSYAEDRSTDEFSDYDVCLFVRDQHKYADDHRWLSEIGEVWLCEKNTGDGELGVSPVHFRLTVFAPGTRVDFSIHSMDMLDQIVTDSPPLGPNLYTLGYRVLVDKDGKTKGMAPPCPDGLTHEKPSESRYREAVENFWHEAHNVAKFLARGDLWSAKFRDWQTKRYLLPMLEWHARAKHGWHYDTAHLGKRMRSWVESETWQALHDAFGHFDAAGSWNALFATVELYRDVPRETAEMLGYGYLEHEDRHMGALIEEMRQNAMSRDPAD